MSDGLTVGVYIFIEIHLSTLPRRAGYNPLGEQVI